MKDFRLDLSRAVRFMDGAPDVTGLPCDEIFDGEGAAYMRRFHLEFTRDRSIRFHQILASDPIADPHDHPWDYTTFLASGGYTEITPDGETYYEAPCVLTRKAEQLHRLVLTEPVWSYIVCGRARRRWGYRTEAGWVPWTRHAGTAGFAPCEPAVPGDRLLAPRRRAAEQLQLLLRDPAALHGGPQMPAADRVPGQYRNGGFWFRNLIEQAADAVTERPGRGRTSQPGAALSVVPEQRRDHRGQRLLLPVRALNSGVEDVAGNVDASHAVLRTGSG
jgi:hypothetical protein